MNDSTSEVRLLTTAQVAERLGISKRHVYNLIRAGKLRRLKIDRAARIRSDDLDAYIESITPAKEAGDDGS